MQIIENFKIFLLLKYNYKIIDFSTYIINLNNISLMDYNLERAYCSQIDR